MITEGYVSFETAKLLKEKGFDEKCFQYYVINCKWDGLPYQEFAIEFRRLYSEDEPLINSKGIKCFSEKVNKHCVFAAPTHQMVMKWLREEHHIFISICPELNEELIDGNHTGMYQEMLYSFNVGQWGESGWHDIPESSNYMEYSTYEEACEVAIKYCLENLF